ncbi:hypothetical protein [Nocardioides speluncae]|uniref:hypothetical protein n=1 Tax=Nocardioides speluncae TaxID=2670337 RepID=UPI0012B17963|nr:hypothetical protein [Nocardioides speluncae]
MYSRSLVAAALAYALLHHIGLLPDGLGPGPEDTRLLDWLDLAVPWLVLGSAAAVLWADRSRPLVWLLFGAGAIAYTSGHGIHLAANSIGHEVANDTVHLWDEPVGHHIWFVGVALVLAALALTMVDKPRPPVLGYVLALAVGLTWATNAVGGGTEVFSLLVALAATAYGWRQRDSLGVVLLVGFLPATATLVALWAAS